MTNTNEKSADANQSNGDFDQQFLGTDGDDHLEDGAGNDTLIGREGRDILEDGLGDDVVVRGAGSKEDTYRYRSGDGNDNISNIGVLELLDLNPDDVRLRGYVGDPHSQAIDILETGQTIRYGYDYVDGEGQATAGRHPSNLVDKIKFADGTVWNEEDLIAALNADETLTGTRGDDVILGYAGNDILEGAQGNDTLYGGTGNDTYRHHPGDGNDTIFDGSGNDTLELSRLKPADVSLSATAQGNLEVLIKETKERIKIGTRGTGAQIDRITFSNRKSWGQTELDAVIKKDVVFSGTDADDHLFGWQGNDRLEGGDGHDRLDGGAGNDILMGGAGNDNLIGGAGRDILEGGLGDDVVVYGAGSEEDTYRYRSGDGNDTIFSIGVLELLDLNPDDVRLRGHVGDPLYSQAIDILETGQTIRFGFGDGEAQATAGHHRSNLVDKIKFADGTVWNEEDLIAALNAGETLTGTMGDDVILGYAGNDILEGAQGNDTLYGGTGNDTYRHHPGDGNDTVFDGSGSDTLELSRLKPADVSLNATARGNLEVLIKETGERIKIGTQGTGAQIDRITFSNRKSWGQTELDAVIKKDVVFSGTDADDHLFGWQGNDRLEGGDGHDRLDGGAGNDILMGGAGNDTLIGGTGRDILEGGLGDDVVVPGAGSEEDTYRYRSGDGNDNIFSIGVLELLDLNPDDVRLLGHVGDPFYSQAIEILETGQTIRFGFKATLK